MNVHFDRRAEIALSSLYPDQRIQVERVLSILATLDESNWQNNIDARALHVINNEALYSVPAGRDLRLLSKIIAGNFIVQDIFPRERLESISGRRL